MTVQIQFPDGSSRSFDTPVTGLKIAESISNSLRKKSVAIRVNDDLQDLTREIETDCTVELITRDTDEGLEVIRHDAAHVLAEAVKELFPETQVTIGPAIENGFYYDFVRDDPFTQEDFEKIEVRMKDIVKRNEEIVR
ncbi:MAG: TGS domain-containing protein, partial [Proteobacteria bacterium]|nr:TGS domain-containing protein [Pseudomonadota bacterium]